jgi:hypothetical protein
MWYTIPIVENIDPLKSSEKNLGELNGQSKKIIIFFLYPRLDGMAQKTRLSLQLRNSNILLFYNNCFQTWSEWITTTEARQKVGNYIGENLSLDHTIFFCTIL